MENDESVIQELVWKGKVPVKFTIVNEEENITSPKKKKKKTIPLNEDEPPIYVSFK